MGQEAVVVASRVAVRQDAVSQGGAPLPEERFCVRIATFSYDLCRRNAGVLCNAVVPDDHPPLAVENECRLLKVVEDTHGYLAPIHGFFDSLLVHLHAHHPGTISRPRKAAGPLPLRVAGGDPWRRQVQCLLTITGSGPRRLPALPGVTMRGVPLRSETNTLEKCLELPLKRVSVYPLRILLSGQLVIYTLSDCPGAKHPGFPQYTSFIPGLCRLLVLRTSSRPDAGTRERHSVPLK